jgi:hypothetical protein
MEATGLIMSVGAAKVQMVRTFCVVTEYADAAKAKAAQDRIAEIRAQAADELPMTLAIAHAGEVFAHG